MKKLLSILMCACLALSVAGCGNKSGSSTKATQSIAVVSPDTLVTAEMASTAAGVTMTMDGSVEYDGSARTVTYVSSETGAADPISVRIEQFSDSLSTDQVFNDYELHRIGRAEDREYISGIGKECFIAYPYIYFFDRGCFVKIMAGSGNSEVQKNTLMSLASQAAQTLENAITEDQAADYSGNVIK